MTASTPKLQFDDAMKKFHVNLGRAAQLTILVEFPVTSRSRAEALGGFTADEIREIAEMFPEIQPYIAKYGPREGYWRWFRSLRRKLKKLVYQQSLVFLVTIFEAFVEDVLRAVFQREPRCLSSSRTIAWENVIELGDYDSIISQFASKRIEDVLSGDWCRIVEEFNKLFNIDLSGEIDGKSMVEIFEMRHAIVHNVGIVDKKFINKVGLSKWGIGYGLNKEIQLNQNVLQRITTFIDSAALVIQNSLLTKFVLERMEKMEISDTLDEEFARIRACTPKKCPFCGGKDKMPNVMLIAPKMDSTEPGYWVMFHCIPCNRNYESNGITVRESK